MMKGFYTVLSTGNVEYTCISDDNGHQKCDTVELGVDEQGAFTVIGNPGANFFYDNIYQAQGDAIMFWQDADGYLQPLSDRTTATPSRSNALLQSASQATIPSVDDGCSQTSPKPTNSILPSGILSAVTPGFTSLNCSSSFAAPKQSIRGIKIASDFCSDSDLFLLWVPGQCPPHDLCSLCGEEDKTADKCRGCWSVHMRDSCLVQSNLFICKACTRNVGAFFARKRDRMQDTIELWGDRTPMLQKRLPEYLFAMQVLRDQRKWVNPSQLKPKSKEIHYQKYREAYEIFAKQVAKDISFKGSRQYCPCYVDVLTAARYLRCQEPWYKGAWTGR